MFCFGERFADKYLYGQQDLWLTGAGVDGAFQQVEAGNIFSPLTCGAGNELREDAFVGCFGRQ